MKKPKSIEKLGISRDILKKYFILYVTKYYEVVEKEIKANIKHIGQQFILITYETTFSRVETRKVLNVNY